MKKLILALSFILITLLSYAGNDDKIVKDTTINKVTYHVYEGKKGGRYIIRTSKTNGTTYKQYFKRS